jgi:hypothetical protein
MIRSRLSPDGVEFGEGFGQPSPESFEGTEPLSKRLTSMAKHRRN